MQMRLKDKITAFFTGLGSILDIAATKPVCFKIGGLEDDSEALRSDWENVMNDLQRACEKEINADSTANNTGV